MNEKAGFVTYYLPGIFKTGREKMAEKQTVMLYLLADDHIEAQQSLLMMGDLCEIVGTDRRVADFVKQLPVTCLNPQDSGRDVISVLMLVDEITSQVEENFADVRCQCQLLGAKQLIIEWHGKKKEARWQTILKILFVSLVILAGSAFTIMTYDQDVDVAGVFARIYQLFTGEIPDQPGILEVAYAFGVAVGILLFFNPFSSSIKRKEPSPIEIEMEKYESDIRDTIVKIFNRQNQK